LAAKKNLEENDRVYLKVLRKTTINGNKDTRFPGQYSSHVSAFEAGGEEKEPKADWLYIKGGQKKANVM
jgi:hypothetical protein